MVRTHLSGIHPRSEDVVEATRRADRGKAEKGEVDRLIDADVDALARTQADAGITDVSAGNLDWQDIFRPLAESGGGIEIGAVTRFFDTNTFYRQPTIVGEVRANGIGKRRELRVLDAGGDKKGKKKQ